MQQLSYTHWNTSFFQQLYGIPVPESAEDSESSQSTGFKAFSAHSQELFPADSNEWNSAESNLPEDLFPVGDLPLSVNPYQSSTAEKYIKELPEHICSGFRGGEGHFIRFAGSHINFGQIHSAQIPLESFTVGYNSTAVHSLPVALNLLSNFLLRQQILLSEAERQRSTNTNRNTKKSTTIQNITNADAETVSSAASRAQIRLRSQMFPFNSRDNRPPSAAFRCESCFFCLLVLLLSLPALLSIAIAVQEIVAHREVFFLNSVLRAFCFLLFNIVFHTFSSGFPVRDGFRPALDPS